MRRILPLCVAAAWCLLPAGPAPGFSDAPAWVAKVRKIAKAPGLSPAQAIQKMDAVFPDNVPLHKRAWYYADVAPKIARERLLAGFHDQGLDMSERLHDARLLLPNETPPSPFGDPGFASPDFDEEYAPWLVEQVLSRRDDMLKPVTQRTLQPIGELGFIAHGFEGFDRGLLDNLKAPRLIPVLIQGLRMPDTVYPDQFGAAGPPGEPTGHNVNRQHLPIVLARLDATAAVPALIDVLKHHHDWYLRDNAAYALGMLLPAKDRESLVAYLRRHRVLSSDGFVSRRDDRFYHLYAFGRGMLAGHDDAGVRYFAPAYATLHLGERLDRLGWMVRDRLDKLEDVRSPKIAGFVRSLFEDKATWAMLTFDPNGLNFGHTPQDVLDFEAEKKYIIRQHDRLCTLIEANGLTGLTDDLTRLARTTRNRAIRRRTHTCIIRLKADRPESPEHEAPAQ